MLKKIFTHQTHSIISAAIIVGGMSLTSRVLGMVRDRILAGTFGASPVLDAYYAAFRLPDFFYNLLVMGAISAGLIPVFTAWREQGKERDGWVIINTVLNISVVVMAVVGVVMAIWAYPIMSWLTPGFTADQLTVAASMTRVMFIGTLCLTVSAIWGSVIQSHRRFFIFSLSPIFYNLGIIAGALWLVPSIGATGLAWGVAIGAAGHMLIQLPALWELGYRPQWRWNLHHAGVRQVLMLTIPRALSLGVGQLFFIGVTVLASLMAAGSLSVFNFSYNLQSVPLGLFGLSFAIAALPALSSLAAAGNKQQFIITTSSALRQMMFFLIPAALFVYALRAQIVRLVLGSGQFGWEDTRVTAATLGVFALSLFAQGAVPLLQRCFFALHNTVTPLIIAIVSTVVSVLIMPASMAALGTTNVFSQFVRMTLRLTDLTPAADIRVISLAIGLGTLYICNLLMLFIALRQTLGGIDGRRIILASAKILLASGVASVVMYQSLYIVDPFVRTDTVVGLLVQSLVAVVVGCLVYAVVGMAVRSQEMMDFLGAWHKRLFRRTKVAMEVTGLE